MTAAILGILATLVPLAVYLIKRHVTKADDPAQQNLDQKKEADAAIARGDERAVNLQLEQSLRELQNRGGSNTGGQGSPPA